MFKFTFEECEHIVEALAITVVKSDRDYNLTESVLQKIGQVFPDAFKDYPEVKPQETKPKGNVCVQGVQFFDNSKAAAEAAAYEKKRNEQLMLDSGFPW